jgi:hypothetical protein
MGLMNTSTASNSTPSTPTNPFCGSLTNTLQPHPNLVLECADAGAVISGVSFASYGTPSGQCPEWSVNASCNAANSSAIVASQCLGRRTCTLVVDTDTFGDPCYGTVKTLDVVVSCSTGGGYQPAPSTPMPVYGLGLKGHSDGVRRVLVVNKAPVSQDVSVVGAAGGSWARIDESTGFGPWVTETLPADTFVLAPFACGIVTLA